MNNLICLTRTFTMVGALITLPSILVMAAETPVPAADETTAKSLSSKGATSSVATTISGRTPAPDPAANLPYGADEVVKLSRGQISDDLILSYVQNSGIAYSLSPDDIVRLRNEGVSDRVINSMLDQHNKAMEVAQRAANPAPVYRDNGTDSASGYSASETAAAPVQGPVVEAPLTPSGSSAYVIPYRPTTYSAYGYYPYPYYSPYYYGGPVVSFRFGFGGSGRGHFHHRRH